MGQTGTLSSTDRERVVRLLAALPGKDVAEQLRIASALAWLGIRTRKREAAVRGRLSSAARGRIGEAYLVPALRVLPALPAAVRCELAMALGDLAGGGAVDGLARLTTASSAEARLIAVDALGKIGGPRAVDALTAAAGDVNETVRAEAARALGQLSGAEKDVDAPEMAAVETLLLEVSAGDPSEYVRDVAGQALAALREARRQRHYAPPERTPAPAVRVAA